MTAVVSLLVVLTLSVLITRIATVALSHTGLSRESARFQARSAFTGVGFTTEESERVVAHPVRRRILLLLMLVGNAGIVTAVSSLILTFISVEGSESPVVPVVLLITGLVALWALAWSGWVDRHLSKLIDRALARYTDLDVRDYASLLQLEGDYRVMELRIERPDWIAGRTLAESALRDEGVLVLGVRRPGGNYLGAPHGDTEVRAGDALILYGPVTALEAVDRRRRDAAGDREHEQAVAEQASREAAQVRADDAAAE